MAFLFKSLEVYQIALSVAEEISKLTDSFPRGTYYLVDQLNRAAISISANIAEGNGRYHKKDRQQFFRIARGSAFECVPLLEICTRKRLITASENNELNLKLESLSKMLSALIDY